MAVEGGACSSVIVKRIRLHDREAADAGHPRGWDTVRSHQRKLKSYRVESAWYREAGRRCDESCRVPRCLGLEEVGGEIILVLEDLDASGFSRRVTSASRVEIDDCLRWLAEFHATFLGSLQTNLWDTGTYWHLGTRPDELEALGDAPLRQAAPAIDQSLRDVRFQTFVHGDAKLANFCFSETGSGVAAVDFQYVGGGCGMKDVAYFIGSAVAEAQCEQLEPILLDHYFECLRAALERWSAPAVGREVEAEWRPLFRVAWADFHRFLKGWCPGHWKINDFSERVCREVVESLK